MDTSVIYHMMTNHGTLSSYFY